MAYISDTVCRRFESCWGGTNARPRIRSCPGRRGADHRQVRRWSDHHPL